METEILIYKPFIFSVKFYIRKNIYKLHFVIRKYLEKIYNFLQIFCNLPFKSDLKTYLFRYGIDTAILNPFFVFLIF